MTQDTPDYLLPAQRINPSALLTATIPANTNVVTVDDTSGFRVGDPCAVTGQEVSVGQQTFLGLAIDALTATTVTLSSNIPVQLVVPGDVVVFPTVQIQAAPGTQGAPVTLAGTGTGSLPQPIPKLVNAFIVNFGTAGVKHIIPAVPGKTISLFQIMGDISAAGTVSGNFQDTAANQVSNGNFVNGNTRYWPYDNTPLPAGVGAGLDFNVINTASGVLLQGHVIYTLQ